MYTKSKDDALDVVQEVLLKALKSSHTIVESKYIATWFYRILINTSIAYINKRRVTYPLEFVSETLKSKESNENMPAVSDLSSSEYQKARNQMISSLFLKSNFIVLAVKFLKFNRNKVS